MRIALRLVLVAVCHATGFTLAHAQPSAVPGANVHVHVSGGLLNAVVYQDVSRSDPVNELVKGVQLRGTANISATPTIELIPDSCRASFDLVTRGVIFTRLIGDADALNVHTDSISPIEIRKHLTVESSGITGWAATTRVLTATYLRGFSSEFPGNIPIALRETAEQIFYEDKYVNDTLASFRIQREIGPRFDKEITPKLQEGGEQFRRGLELTKEHGIELEQFGFATSRTALTASARLGSDQMVDLKSAPAIPAAADIAIRVHEAPVNRYLQTAFGGKEVSEKELKASAKRALDALGLKIDLKPAPLDVSLRFAAKEPITVAFNENSLVVAIDVEKFNLPTGSVNGAKIRVRFNLERGQNGIAIVRHGRVELLTSTGTVLQDEIIRAALEQMLPPRIDIGSIPVSVGAIGALTPTTAVAQNGWLLSAWRRGR